MRGLALALSVLLLPAAALAEVSAEARDALIADIVADDIAQDDAEIIVDCGLAQLEEGEVAALNAATTVEERDDIMAEAVDFAIFVECAGHVLDQ
jgi:hypothetical protein